MVYRDKEKQKKAQAEWVRQKRAAKGSTRQGSTPVEEHKAKLFRGVLRSTERPKQGVTAESLAAQGFTKVNPLDPTGKEHLKNFEGWRKVKAQLRAWAEGKGTPDQQALGILAGQYDILKNPPKDLIHTLNTLTVAELEAEGYWIPCWKLNTNQTYEQVHQAIAGIELPA